MANSTLAAIQTKVRRLTRNLSPAQLTDAQLNEYINTAIQYDFPEHLRLANLRTTFSFFTNPFVDKYYTTTNPNNEMFNFDQKYLTVHPPVYVAGYQASFLESREKLYGMFPRNRLIASIGATGDGVTTRFAGTLPNLNPGVCLLSNNVLFDSIDIFGDGLAMQDWPISATEGNLYAPGGAPTSTTVLDPDNYINYVSGAFVVTFPTAPFNGEFINSQTVPTQTSRPTTVCFFDGGFIVRPVPDQSYEVNMEVYVRPTELLQAGESPELQEWWQYIAYLASKKVFEDKMDLESVQLIMPELKKQENLIQRRTIVQQTSQRVATIYTEDNNQSTPFGPNSNGAF